jgi:hypothetical protein
MFLLTFDRYLKQKMLLTILILFLYATITVGVVDEHFFQSCRTGDQATVKQYLDSGVSVHSRDGKGNTAIIIASGRGQTEIIKLLLAYGANPEDATALGIFEGKSSIW